MTNTELEFERTLIVSSQHITRADALKLDMQVKDSTTYPNLMCDDHPFGHTVIMGQEETNEMIDSIKEDFSEGFIKCLEIARDNKVHSVRFDSDGTVYEQLETYDN